MDTGAIRASHESLDKFIRKLELTPNSILVVDRTFPLPDEGFHGPYPNPIYFVENLCEIQAFTREQLKEMLALLDLPEAGDA